MRYQISYVCISHTGRVRTQNEDNFICNGTVSDPDLIFPLEGSISRGSTTLFGVFDGLGGESCGDVASAIAANHATAFRSTKELPRALSVLCQEADSLIYEYARQHKLDSMGTTAALMAFGKKEIALCNVGDSKIFRFHKGTLEQISEDHTAVAIYGHKPPLTQALGTPPDHGAISPYLAKGRYYRGDTYLLCSDGLTDMVRPDLITKILAQKKLSEAGSALVDAALLQGGTDNITLILCKIEGLRLFRCIPKFRRKKQV